MSPGSINTTRTPKRHVSSRKLSLALRPRTCVTGVLLAHDGQHGAADAEHAEEVGLHLRAGFGDGAVFDRPHQGPAGIVHDRIETAGFLHNGGDGARDRVIVVYVHGEHIDAVETGGLAPAGAEHAPAPRARWRAMASPIPEEAPVTRTTLKLAGRFAGALIGLLSQCEDFAYRSVIRYSAGRWSGGLLHLSAGKVMGAGRRRTQPRLPDVARRSLSGQRR